VTDPRMLEALWRKSAAAFGRIDIWINNAGAINTMTGVTTLDPDEIMSVPRTNLIGTIHGCRVALNGMTAQDQIDGVKGAIYNFEGFGSDGTKTEGLSVYGATKFGLTYFTKSLIKETKGGPVLVGFMSPGLVTTDMLLRAGRELAPDRWAKTKKIYRIIANDVDTVAAWLVDRVLANRRHGAHIAWLTRIKAVGRFVRALFVKPKPLPELEAA
jgi:NAD(P)-dependent dehydrogenase (short-subunit alcohol dehydrogenase family)